MLGDKTSRSRGSTGDSQKGLGAFLKGKKSLKGLFFFFPLFFLEKWCASPFLQLRVGPRVKQKIRTALIARKKN